MDVSILIAPSLYALASEEPSLAIRKLVGTLRWIYAWLRSDYVQILARLPYNLPAAQTCKPIPLASYLPT